ncbi:MAG TPA: CpaD family pilus assembly lipoprotein, partial [Sphingomonadales bacterium]|nr:CpaD family pilus assembly lipoprotein [Sphingomonadales bacterium]
MRFFPIVSLAAALALAGCAHQPQRNLAPDPLPENTVAEPANFSHLVHFSGPGGTLSETDKAVLNAFISAQGVGYGDELYLDVHPSDVSWQGKLAALNAHLKTRGLWVWNASATGAVTDPATASFEVNRYTVNTPNCFGISQQTFPKGQTSRWPVFGCTTAHNLGVMVASPQDLTKGKPDAGPLAHYATRAIQLYRARFANMGWAVEPASSLVGLTREPRREESHSGE